MGIFRGRQGCGWTPAPELELGGLSRKRLQRDASIFRVHPLQALASFPFNFCKRFSMVRLSFHFQLSLAFHGDASESCTWLGAGITHPKHLHPWQHGGNRC